MIVIPTADELFDRIAERLDQYQVDGWLGRDGEEFYRAVAAVGSVAIGKTASGILSRLIQRARVAARATTTVTVTWSGSPTYAVGLRVGQVVLRSAWGVTYRLAADLAHGTAAGAETVAAEAEWTGSEGNIEAGFLATWALPTQAATIRWSDGTSADAQAEFLAGVADGSITIAASADATGGRDGTLDLIGGERGLPRISGESEDDYRRRVRRVPAGITKTAIMEAVDAIVAEYGVTATGSEPWEYGFTIGESAIGEEGIGIFRPWHFVVEVPLLGYEGSDGFTIGESAIGEDWIGDTEDPRRLVVLGIQNLVDQMTAAGIWGVVREADNIIMEL